MSTQVETPTLFAPHPNFSDRVNGNIIQAEIEGGIDLRHFSPGTVLEVQTRNHVYRLVSEQNGEAWISGHPVFCPDPGVGRYSRFVFAPLLNEGQVLDEKPAFFGTHQWRHRGFPQFTECFVLIPATNAAPVQSHVPFLSVKDSASHLDKERTAPRPEPCPLRQSGIGPGRPRS
jgi:hypothetical protein